MKIKNNIKKASIGLLVSAIAVSGAFAWLKSSETASKQNELVVGSIDIKFENQLNKVELSDNTAIPMTKAEAVATLTPYTFDIANKGSVYLDYVVSVDSASYQNAFPENGVNVLIAPIADGATDEEIKTALTNATVKKLTSTKDLANSSLNISEHKRYAMIAYIDKGVKLAEYTGANLSFKLRVDAIQHNVLNAENYETLSKSQIATSITAGGETKNVEVYNIEGDSKADLLDKLDKSGLTDASTVDAIIEVKGEEYDGINSTATFDVSSIANPGDEVVILHFNEETQEWEYIGRETVAEDSTVSGDFTSYSPVAFIVYKPDGSIVTKEYDSNTGVLIKETETKTDGSKIETEYDEKGEVNNIVKEVNMSNVNIKIGDTILAQGDFSTKGNLVTINNTQYRVLSVNGMQAKVMSMENFKTVKYGEPAGKFDGGKFGELYSKSNVDAEMINYYNSLPDKIKASIVEQNINQTLYKWTYGYNDSANFVSFYKGGFDENTTYGDNYYLNKVDKVNVGMRKVFILDVDDIIEYVGRNGKPQDINEMFWNVRRSYESEILTRSANTHATHGITYIDGHNGYFGNNYCSNDGETRPAFVIDISLLV